MDCPTKPGLYPDLTYDQYNAIPAIRGSDLTPYLVSPRRARWKKNHPPSSEALRLGLAYHTAILEPHLFEQDVAVLGPCCMELKSGKRKGQPCMNAGKYFINNRSYCGTHGDESQADKRRTIISEQELNQIISAKTALMQRPAITEILNKPHQNELTGVWQDETTGELCKFRLDQKNVDGEQEFVELKTTSAPTLNAYHCESEIRKYGYHIKAAFQQAGCKALGIDSDYYLFLFIQTTQDCDVAAYWLSENTMELGDQIARKCLADLVKARDTNTYPGVQPNELGVIEVRNFND